LTEGSPGLQPAIGLVAELWYEQPPELADGSVLAALRSLSPKAQAQGSSLTVPDPTASIAADPKASIPADPTASTAADPAVESGGSARPLVTVVMAGSALGTDGKQLPDVSQTWDWAEAEAAVARGRASLLVTELLTDGSTPQQRLAALSAVVAELADGTEPLAISWPQSQRVSDPARFAADDLDGVINVRLFTVAGDAEAMVMDTLGLHVFGLPDVQCHFRGRDPGEIAAMLFTTGVYIFESGDVILDGNTISEPDGQGRYVCRREPALLGPPRTVLDVDLGDPYAAGERDRNP